MLFGVLCLRFVFVCVCVCVCVFFFKGPATRSSACLETLFFWRRARRGGLPTRRRGGVFFAEGLISDFESAGLAAQELE